MIWSNLRETTERDHAMELTLLDDRGTVLWVSEPLPGYRADEVVGKPYWEFAAPKVADEMRSAVMQALDGKKSDRLLTLYLTGRTRHFRTVFRPVTLDAARLVLVSRNEVRPEFLRLSNRQREVLRCLIECQSNAEVSGRLNLSERTVESHLRNIRRILSVNTRSRLISFAMQHFQEI